ncbi:uncharacterized protein LOC126569801 [Anopheles aquasalis]|uniref:uncharacterized protein LOC126569801 n=1 Tax=Anopheles aquasalis TaxID=42839 RepID=UPI00215AFE64|nr:uncharacterized protein LOC126569801 [Anopheles aquasalis]
MGGGAVVAPLRGSFRDVSSHAGQPANEPNLQPFQSQRPAAAAAAAATVSSDGSPKASAKGSPKPSKPAKSTPTATTKKSTTTTTTMTKTTKSAPVAAVAAPAASSPPSIVSRSPAATAPTPMVSMSQQQQLQQQQLKQQQKQQNQLPQQQQQVIGPKQTNTKTVVSATGTPTGTPIPSRKVISSVQISLQHVEAPTNATSNSSNKQKQNISSPSPASAQKPSAETKQQQTATVTAAPKSAFAVVGKDPLAQRSISMLELHRTTAQEKLVGGKMLLQHANSGNASVASALASPALSRKQKQPLQSHNTPPLSAQPAAVVELKAPAPAPVVPAVSSRARTLSSDEQCFEQLRKKHEAIFAQAKPADRSEADAVATVPPTITSPRTLAEVRSSLLVNRTASQEHTATATVPTSVKSSSDIAPQYREGINQLVMELMPGMDERLLDDEVPVPRQRQRSSFERERIKLQRSQSAAAESSRGQYRMEVVRESAPGKRASSGVESRLGSEEKMQIRLERSVQIKEQYAKQATGVALQSAPPPAAPPQTTTRMPRTYVLNNVPEDVDRQQGILTRDRSERSTGEVTDFDALLLEQQEDESSSVAASKEFDLLLAATEEEQEKEKEPKLTEPAAQPQLSGKEFDKTVSELTEKFLQTKKMAAPARKPEVGKTLTALDDAIEPSSQTEVDLLEELCKPPEADTAKEKLDSSDLINSSAIAELAPPMPDVISMTEQKQQQQQQQDEKKNKSKSPNQLDDTSTLKILQCMPTLKNSMAVPMPAPIQVYTLHTTDGSPVEPAPSTQGMSGNYAHILRDITSGLVGADFAGSVVYEPPSVTVVPERTDFQLYKQRLEEKKARARESAPEAPGTGTEHGQPQRPLRRPKQKSGDSDGTSGAATAFDNSICIDPWRARKSASIENIAIEQVFVKRNNDVVDTFFVVPDKPEPGRACLLRRSKSYDRLAVPGPRTARSKRSAELEADHRAREFGYDLDPPSLRSRQLVDPRLRHLDIEGSDEELASLRGASTSRHRFRKNKSMSDVRRRETGAAEPVPPKVDIDRESPRPRTTDFSKWEAILDRGVTYYEGSAAKPLRSSDIKGLERRIEELEVRKARPARRKAAIPRDYDPDEYVPRINRRAGVLDAYGALADPTLPRDYDPDEYVPRPNRPGLVAAPVQPLPRSYDPDEYIPRANRREPASHEIPVPIQRGPAKYLRPEPAPVYPEDSAGPYGVAPGPPPASLGRSKTMAHVPVTSSSGAAASMRSYDLPARDIARTQYARRYDAEDRHIVDRSHRLHEKTNKYIRSQVTRNDPNPYIREMLENESDDEIPTYHQHQHHHHHHPISSSAAITTAGYRGGLGTSSSYGTSGAAAMSRIQTKAITQPSRMMHYAGGSSGGSGAGPRPSSSYDSRRRTGASDAGRSGRDNCNIS